MLHKRELKRYKISIAAIIKDEFDYIEEWIAYHKLLGFEHFYIADNGSTDGTSEYLQALEQVGLVTRIFQADGAKIQLDAYNKILRKYGHETELLLFIDCDEFVNLTESTKRYSKEIESLVSLFKDPLVGAVALNWRVFGSSGLEKKSDGLVTERFTYSSKEQHKKNRYFKTVVRPSHVEYMRVHHAHLVQGSKYLNTEGKPLLFQDNQIGGISQTFCNKIIVNHYIIKSLDEFISKKQKRGDAMVGKNHEKSISYFHTNDLNDIENISLVSYSKKIKSSINKIKKAMASKSDYNKILVGYIDTYNDKLLRGWVRYQGSHKNKAIKLTIRENNRETLLTVNRFRKDLFIENKYDGCDGFHYLFEQPLKSRENQNIRVYANSFSFPKSNSEIVIDTAEGILGVISPSIITGWAINQTNEIAVDLIIKINDELLCEIKADGDRPDIKKLGMHETGKCGFSVRNFDSHVIRAGTKIEAIVKETGQHLKNSPYVIPSKLSDSISYKPLLFLHIPKTAGTSFRTALQEIYSKKETLQDYGDKSSETSHIIIKEAENRGVLIPYMIENKTAFITGHFHARKYLALLKDDVQWCTFLRDPIDRVLSEYNHLVANNTYHVSFTAFYRQHPQINRQTKLMSGLSLEEFFFIGITEEYTLSIKLFNYLTNSNIPSLELNINRNKNKTVSNSLDKETLKELKNLNAKDYKLYELAKKNLQKTCKNLGIH